MIKGVYKNTVIIKSPGSIIEEAIFIIKPSAMKDSKIDSNAVIKEISKILRDKTDVGVKDMRGSDSVVIKKNRKN